MAGVETEFRVLCSLFNWMQRSKSAAKKRSKFRKFLDTFCQSGDYFTSIRLILPALDRERGSYGLKESVLATCLIDALGMSRDSEDAIRLINWRKGGAKTGVNVGNFALVAAEVLQRRQGMASGGLTIKELNDLLDRLAQNENRAEKTSTLSTLINKTNSLEMKWIVMIILKDLKLGVSERSIFHEFHPDAEDLFNVTCDLRLVCEKLKDRSQRHKRQDIEVGKAVRPQLATRVADAATAWKKLHGKEVLVECKFDGDRIQIHKKGTEIHFFSRNFLNHSEYSHAMSDLFTQNILVDRCILDGEMLVWDTSLNHFSDFGSNQEIAKAAKDGLDCDRQLCYVAFDILYVGDTSVIHQSLRERHELLQKVLKPLKGRLEILVPDGGLNADVPSGAPSWSFIAHNVNDVERFFKETIENRGEGIVLKDLHSKWEPSDRSGKWLKLKPDYIRAGSDLDVLIIGGYYGSGRRGGEVAQFLVGLAERCASSAYPKRFISFCRVGTGLSDEELDAVVTKLKPYFRKFDYRKKAPPSCYQVTNNSKERPDVWIENPEMSIILSITSDIRTIKSEVFAAPYSLRFPRIDRVRYDKPWHECLDIQSFVELVNASNGTTHKGTDYGSLPDNKPKGTMSSRKGGKRDISVPSQFSHTDISEVTGQSLIFSAMVFYFVNVPSSHSLKVLHKMVVEQGGAFSMNLNISVTHCVAAESKGIKYQAAKLWGDVIHYSWVLDCCIQKKLLQLQPKYFLFLSGTSKKKSQEELDEFSDSYYVDVDFGDIKPLLSSLEKVESSRVDYYKGKYCPKRRWSILKDCRIYFHCSTLSLNLKWVMLLELAMKRLKLETSMGGGKVSDRILYATHLVVLSVPGIKEDFSTLLRSFPAAEQPLLRSRRLNVVGSQWLEDSLEREHKLEEDIYSLRPKSLEESDAEDCQNLICEAPNLDVKQRTSSSSSPSKAVHQGGKAAVSDTQKMSTSSKTNSKSKRGRPSGKSTMLERKATFNQRRRIRGRHGNKAGKVYENVSDGCPSEVDEKKNHAGEGFSEITGPETGIDFQMHENQIEGSLEPSQSTLKEQKPVVEETDYGERLERGCELNFAGRSKCDESEKQTLVDPIEAMLLDMIPSLRNNKTETTKDPVLAHEQPQSEFNLEPVKKRKVSYKNTVDNLLKDW